MTLDEAMKQINSYDIEPEYKAIMAMLVDRLCDTYAKAVPVEKEIAMAIMKMRETDGIGIGIVDYRGDKPEVLLSNEHGYADAFKHPELIEVEE
ncbi:hypothetical protein [Weissella minor]|uniref:Uncharacterized protein n=1 Tax=Weissella minor TaxID=1620 RepID=A0A0R2JK33_9LACO|nr:hypothetical protein [Weissella minor]KRN77602.1 hypothetical protein IV67_GL001446 [Weissella minor]